MAEVLSRSLRPKSLSRLFGQEPIVEAIRKQIKSGRIPRTYMLVGETGSGKTTIAKILAKAFNCPHHSWNKFGEFCKQCAVHRSEIAASIEEINAAKHNKKEEISRFVEMAEYAPIPPAIRRVMILDEAQRLSKDAQDVLLKPTEHPPAHMIWIISTTEPYDILKTLRRRCTIYSLLPLKHTTAEAFIKWAAKKAGIKRPLSDFIHYVHSHQITSPAIILNMLEHFSAGMDPDRAASDSPLAVNTMRIYKSLTSGEWGGIRAELVRASAEDIRLIRGSILGLLKHQLLQHTPGLNRKSIVFAIETLAEIPYSLDEASQMALLSAKLYSLCGRFEKG